MARLLFALLLSAVYISLISAQPLPNASPSLTSPTSSNKSSSTCGIPGTADTYGPGIRIGIYSQIVAISVTKFFIPSQSLLLRDTLTVFTVAILTVTIIYATEAASVYAVEFFIVLQILNWNCLTGVRARDRYSMGLMKDRTVRRWATEGMSVVALAVHAWFWFCGLDLMQSNPCGDRVFFFADVELGGWFRDLMKFMTILGLVEHLWIFSGRLGDLWGRGVTRRRDEEKNSAMRDFEEWKKARQMHDSKEDIKEAVQVCETATHPQAENLSKKQPIASCTPASGTWNTTSTLADDETMSLKSAQITTQPPDQLVDAASSSSSSNLSTSQQYPSNKPGSPFQLFEEIHAGELFLEHCVSKTATAEFQSRHPVLYRLFLLSCSVAHPTWRASNKVGIPPDCPSYKTCVKIIAKALFTLRFPRHASVLFTHLKSIGIMDPLNGTYQVHAALTYAAPVPAPHVLVLASAIQVANLPRDPPHVKWTQVCNHFTIHIFVMLQIELTIKWNGIRDLGGVGNVGQLIPLLVGAGSLALVVGRGIEGALRGERVWEEDSKLGKDEFAVMYEEWKAMRGRGEMVAGVHQAAT